MLDHVNEIKLISGNSNKALAEAISAKLEIALTPIEVSKFQDGEIHVEIMDSVRSKDVYVVQPTCAPVNDTLMELMLITDAALRSGANSVSGIIPYYGYSRQDRRPEQTRTPISSRVVADMLQNVGMKQILFVDIHTTQQVGFFKIPALNITASPIIIADIWRNFPQNGFTIVSPDIGGVPRSRAIAKQLNAPLAIIDKRRPVANVSEVMNIIGDIKNQTCIIIDDMIDTAGTICKAAKALMDNGAKEVVIYATHPVFSGNAYKNFLEYKEYVSQIVVTDSIQISLPNDHDFNHIRVLSISGIIAETLRRIHTGLSVSEILL